MMFKIVLVSEVLQGVAIPCDGKLRLVLQSRKTRQLKSEGSGLRFYEKTFAVLEEHDPCVPDAVATVPSEDNSSVESHREELTPSPEREVLAVTRLALFEFLRWLPVIPFAKQFFIGDAAATTEKLPNILDGFALYC